MSDRKKFIIAVDPDDQNVDQHLEHIQNEYPGYRLIYSNMVAVYPEDPEQTLKDIIANCEEILPSGTDYFVAEFTAAQLSR